MKKRRLRSTLTHCLIIMMLIWLVLPRPTEAQQSDYTASWSLASLSGSDVLRLQGYRPSAVLTLTLPAWQAAGDGTLVLDYRLSELVLEEAVLTIRFNNQTLYSVPFEATAGLLRFRLPADLWQSGKNSLELVAILPLSEDNHCLIPSHPARWLEFSPTSSVDVPLTRAEDPLNLANFSDYFASVGDLTPAPITFVIPAEVAGGELSALSRLAFALAQNSSSPLPWTAVSTGDFDPEQLAGPVVMAAVSGHNRFVDQLSPSEEPQTGWLSVSRPNWAKGQPVLAAGGPDEAALLQAAGALLDPVAAVRLQGEQAVVDTLPRLDPVVPAGQSTLAGLGYPERTVRGAGQHALIYSFDLPFAWTPNDGQLHLRFAYAAQPDPHAAALDTSLNGRPVTRIILDAPELAVNEVDVPLPATLLRPGRNFLRLTFDFGTPVELCDWDIPAGLWATVRPDTTLSFPHQNSGGRLNLEDFPYLFASEMDLNNLVIVLPARSDADDVTRALAIIQTLAMQSWSRAAPRLLVADAVDQLPEQVHLIILGPVDRQPWLEAANRYLPLPFDLARGTLPTTYGFRLPTAVPDLGVLQLLRSPWAEERVLLLTGGTTSAGYAHAVRLLVEPDLQAQLAGQVVLTTAPDPLSPPSIYTQHIGDIYAIPAVGQIDRIFDRLFGSGSPWPAVIMVITGMALLALFIFLGLRWLRHYQAKSLSGHQ